MGEQNVALIRDSSWYRVTYAGGWHYVWGAGSTDYLKRFHTIIRAMKFIYKLINEDVINRSQDYNGTIINRYFIDVRAVWDD